MHPAIPVRTYYPALNALRGFAILIVLLHHYFSRFQIGWAGVDLFFVLSGFLITDILFKQPFSKFYLLRFYWRRALRILPLYYLSLGLFFACSALLFSDKGPNSTYQYYIGHQLWFWSFLQNWLFIKIGPPDVPYLSPLWSLAVEWQFYLVWPFLLHVAAIYRAVQPFILLLIALSLVLRIYIYFQNPDAISNYYYNSVCRMDSLLMGSLLAVRLANGKIIHRTSCLIFGAAALLLLFICGLTYHNLDKNNVLMATIGYTILALFFMAILYRFVTGFRHLPLWFRPLSFLGKISYSIYLIHIPIYLMIAAKLPLLLQQHYNIHVTTPYLVVSISFVLTIMVSTASFYFIEMPFMRLKPLLD